MEFKSAMQTKELVDYYINELDKSSLIIAGDLKFQTEFGRNEGAIFSILEPQIQPWQIPIRQNFREIKLIISSIRRMRIGRSLR